MPALLRLERLVKRYPSGDEALRGVDLEVPAGQVMALIGPSGAGKSTLIRCVNRLVEPTSGRVLLDGVDVSRLPAAALRRARRQMGMIFRHHPAAGAVVATRTVAGVPVWRRRDRGRQLAVWLAWLGGVGLFLACWQVIAERTMWVFVWDAPQQGADLLARMVPPRWSYLPALWRPLWDTVNMATLGTVAAIVLAVPIAFLAARNTTPSTTLVRPLALLLIVSSRSINSLIWALLLVSIIGPGVLAGTVAIALRSIGFVAKLLYEAIEEIDGSRVEAITATGAGRGQVVTFGIVPQILPAFAGISVFRWDINIRESTVLGLVGAGGIGLQLQASVNVLAWPQVTMIFLVIFATVLVSEWVSARVRHAII